MLDVGATIPDNVTPLDGRPQNPLRILWSGVFEHHKALHLLLMALGKVSSGVDFRIRILGSGPLKKRWKRMAGKYRIENHFSWMGWLSHAEALAQYEWADVFVFTSLRDTCGTVVLEALSRGVPVICLDHQGVGDVITDQCGIKIPVTRPKEVVAGLKDAIVRLANDRTRLQVLSAAALARARQYLWEDNGRQMGTIYKTIGEERSSRSS